MEKQNRQFVDNLNQFTDSVKDQAHQFPLKGNLPFLQLHSVIHGTSEEMKNRFQQTFGGALSMRTFSPSIFKLILFI